MSFQKTEIDFSVTKSLSRLVSDYLTGNKGLKSFYSSYPDETGFVNAINTRSKFPADRNLLAAILKEQNSDSHASAKKNIELLTDRNTFTVTTGHQLNLFTGPLYFIYKILTTIKLTQHLNEKFAGKKFVPVYWMASEDHDIEEINHTFLHGKKVEWNTVEKGAAGKLSCEGMEAVIENVTALAGAGENAREIISQILYAYKKEHSLSRATRIFADGLFGQYGLVILDADDARLKKLFIPVMQDDLTNQTAYKKTLETISELHQSGYESQVTPREINLFYLQKNSRERIVQENGLYKVLHTMLSWNKEELIRELNENPGSFSPNVLLRTLYQETLLPNIAYIGGPAEVAYWLEYKKVFEHYKINYPLLILRNCAMIIDDVSAEKMRKLGISNEDIFKNYDELAREFIRRNPDSFSLETETAKINAVYDSMISKILNVDSTLAKSMESERQKQLNSLKSLEEKVARALKKKHEVSLQQIQKLKEKFFPGGVLQERHENFIPFYARHGSVFFDQLLSSFEVPAERFHVLAEKVPVAAGD
jgi:bacillithiol biosynthesis cysteine-adding enzyme BshC